MTGGAYIDHMVQSVLFKEALDSEARHDVNKTFGNITQRFTISFRSSMSLLGGPRNMTFAIPITIELQSATLDPR